MEQQIIETSPPPDRRRSLRVPLIVLKVVDGTDRSTLFGYAKQISRSGMFISSISPRRPGERFGIAFEIPDSKATVRCECEVVWNREYKKKSKFEAGYGVKFLDLPETAASAIETWIASQE